MTQPILVCRDLSKRFGHTAALWGANLELREGGLLALLGPSGCGKTTLLRLIAGFEMPDAGEIELRGRLISSPSHTVPPEKRGVSMVFQDFALFPHLSVGANVAFGLPRGVNKQARVAELLALIRLESLAARMPHELSGGQQQRVALARALASEPALVLLDEPFSNLDPSIRADVRDEVRHLLETVGITAMIVTHDQEEALSLAGEVAVMMDGEVLQVGTPGEVYARPVSRRVGEFVGAANILPGKLEGRQVECELGRFAVDAGFSGLADVMFRAETLAISAEGGVAAEVTDVDYYGHDQMVTARLRSGAEVRLRLLALQPYAIGQQLTIAATAEPLVFPRQTPPG